MKFCADVAGEIASFLDLRNLYSLLFVNHEFMQSVRNIVTQEKNKKFLEGIKVIICGGQVYNFVKSASIKCKLVLGRKIMWHEQLKIIYCGTEKFVSYDNRLNEEIFGKVISRPTYFWCENFSHFDGYNVSNPIYYADSTFAIIVCSKNFDVRNIVMRCDLPNTVASNIKKSVKAPDNYIVTDKYIIVCKEPGPAKFLKIDSVSFK